MKASEIQALLDEPACDHNKKEKSGCAKPKPGATAGGCSFDGAQIALLPIADVAHIVHGPIACAGSSWDNRGTRSSGVTLYKIGMTTDLSETDVVMGRGEKRLFHAIKQAVEVANYVAPEHLELLVKESSVKGLLRDITTAGAIMVGNYTPTSLGDFIAGPSHVLPTGRAGRFFSGLRVADFMRRTSVIRYDKTSVKKAAPVVSAFAQMEQLDAHGRSAEIRAK